MKPTKIYTLGDYYNDEGLRDLCHYVKNGHPSTKFIAEFLVKMLIDQIPENSVLIPVRTTHSHFDDYLEKAAEKYRPTIDRVFTGIWTNGEGSVYEQKKKGLIVTPKDVPLDLARTFNKHHFDGLNIVLMDNVIDTGVTMARCIDLIGHPCEAMCIAVNWENYNQYNW
jgi:hypothetical protein